MYARVSHHMLGSISLLRTAIDMGRGTKVNEVNRSLLVPDEDVPAVEIQMENTLSMDVAQYPSEINGDFES